MKFIDIIFPITRANQAAVWLEENTQFKPEWFIFWDVFDTKNNQFRFKFATNRKLIKFAYKQGWK
jgi:hypothetical protein